ncbi:hypothetical protein MROS_1564 [Melioribacter roseus P3M-2]|uniref:Uncharacterized protein n=1 Tax=Melioribacter roseus (strain DSM 23840 / JCM 17771 / VKM B-2668 / P3M-2) TaxID=1191523 RepID=I7A4H6_MELRP|nr:hypothetical protein [Melioribacter roseus]AFN74801.1 hypothetical protein MROS_1564 [Melioribacter roseus P3M-2]
MKRLLIIFFLFLPFLVNAQNINGRITSSFYSFERYNTASSSETFFRTYQALNLNANYSKFSLRTRFNFESNLGNALDADPRVRFYNLYLEARDLFGIATVKLGRQPLFTPVAGGLFDGINLKLKYAGFSLTGFYGGNLPAYQKLELTDDLSNDYIMGGRFETVALKNFRLGVSYIDKNFKSVDYYAERLDENLDPVTILIQSKSNQYKLLSADAYYSYNNLVDVSTRYEYDLNYEVTSKVEFDGRVNATDKLGLNFYYNYREPRIRYNSIFSVFDYGNSQEIEGGFDYKISRLYRLFFKYGDVKFDSEHSSRLSLGVTTQYGSISYRKTLGDAGELDAASLYLAKSFVEGLITPSVGVTYTSYKLSSDDETNSITALLAGLNFRPWRILSFDFQTQYFNNKIYKNDFRVLFKVNYLFNTNL